MSLKQDVLNRELSAKDRDYFSYDKTSSDLVAKRVVIGDDVGIVNNSPFGAFDKVAVAYPTSTKEVFTYSLDGVSLGNVVVDYTNTSKRFLSLVTYNVV